MPEVALAVVSFSPWVPLPYRPGPWQLTSIALARLECTSAREATSFNRSQFAATVGRHACLEYPPAFRSRMPGRMDEDEDRTADHPPGQRADAASEPSRADPFSRLGSQVHPEHWLILLLLALSFAGAIRALLG